MRWSVKERPGISRYSYGDQRIRLHRNHPTFLKSVLISRVTVLKILIFTGKTLQIKPRWTMAVYLVSY